MTTTRINHTGHNHPNTTAARTACRKAMAKATPAAAPVAAPIARVAPAPIADRHCTNCGTTNHEALTTGDNGYSACCNEPIVGRCASNCNHN